jgi:hypothetical protein
MDELQEPAAGLSEQPAQGRHAGRPVDEAAGSEPTGSLPVPAHAAPVDRVTPAPVLVARRPGKVRSPVAGWILGVITLGVYVLFWYHHLNRELRDFDSSISVRPGLAVLALIVPVVGWVSVYNTGGRIRQAQTLAGVAPTASGGLGVLLTFVFGLFLPYYDSQSNQAWRAAGAS